jgi:hypothetical protein
MSNDDYDEYLDGLKASEKGDYGGWDGNPTGGGGKGVEYGYYGGDEYHRPEKQPEPKQEGWLEYLALGCMGGIMLGLCIMLMLGLVMWGMGEAEEERPAFITATPTTMPLVVTPSMFGPHPHAGQLMTIYMNGLPNTTTPVYVEWTRADGSHAVGIACQMFPCKFTVPHDVVWGGQFFMRYDVGEVTYYVTLNSTNLTATFDHGYYGWR